MVRVKSYSLREGEKGQFVLLKLEGDLEMVQSSKTGRFYATVKACTVSSTFDEETAALMVGKQMPGTIERIQCDDYEYTLPESGEIIHLAHRYDYVPEVRKAKMPQSFTTVSN